MQLGPRSVERPGDTGVTSVHVFGSGPAATVDGGGLLQLDACGWALDWWIGADDRWYYPSREATVRQRRIGSGPVIETSVRIPSGDAVQTVYAVNVGGRDVTVVEIRNDSPVPVALALAIRPFAALVTSPSSSVSTELSVDRVDEVTLAIEGDGEAGLTAHLLNLPRKPNQIGSSSSVDLWGEIEAGRNLQWVEGTKGPEANAVCLYPLPHKTSLRFVLSTGLSSELPDESSAGQSGAVTPSSVPDSEAVARGWTSIVEANARFELPDSGLTQLAKAARARVISAAPLLGAELVARLEGGLVLKALATGGYSQECENLLLQLANSFPTSIASPLAAAEVLDGTAHAAALVDNPALTDRLLEPMAQLLHLIERSKDTSAIAIGRRGLSKLAVVGGQLEPARELWQKEVVDSEIGCDADGNSAAEQLPALAETASPSGRWTAADGTDSVAQAVRFWSLTRNASLVEQLETIQTEDPTVILLPQFPASWRGGPVELHRAPTLFGWVSFAIRWHGHRPALLWEVEPARYLGEMAVTLRCPGLDPDWSTSERVGEALLAGTTEELPDAPQPGDSFT